MTGRAARTGILLLAVVALASLGPAVGPVQAAEGISAARLQKTHGTGEIRGVGRAWSDAELRVLDASLKALAPKERAALKGVDLVRRRHSPRLFAAGLYRFNRQGARIVVYDRAFKGDGRGSASRPNRTLMHEFGHAFEHAPVRRAVGKARRAIRAANDTIDAYNAAARRFNRVSRGGDRAAIKRARKRLDQLGEAAEARRADAKKATRRANRLNRRHRSPLPREGVLRDYRRALRGRLGPTSYGRLSLQESFAESFSLFRCDPARLKKKLPRVHAWFSEAGHLGSR